MDLQDQTHIDPDLYGASVEQLLARLREVDQPVASVLLVGHNPGLQDLVLQLSSHQPEWVVRLSVKFPTGGLAAFVIDDGGWSELARGNARMISLTVPRDIHD